MDSAEATLLKKRAAPILGAEQEGWWGALLRTQGDEVGGPGCRRKAGFLETCDDLLDLISRDWPQEGFCSAAAGAVITLKATPFSHSHRLRGAAWVRC